MNRNEAIAAVGIAAVKAVEAQQCEPTSRAYEHEPGKIEWSASVDVDYDTLSPEQVRELPIGGCYLVAYYYTYAQDSERVEASGGDWGIANWNVDRFEIA